MKLILAILFCALALSGQTLLIPDVFVLPKADGTATGVVRFYDLDASNSVGFKAPATVVTDVSWTLPAVDGNLDEALATNGTATLSWRPFVTLDTVQTITGAKTFTETITAHSIYPETEDTHYLGAADHTWYNVSANYVGIVANASLSQYKFYMLDTHTLYLYDPVANVMQSWDNFQDLSILRATLIPSGGNSYNLGASGYRWEDAYIDDLVLTDSFKLEAGASNGYVLTSDSSGNGTWQAGGGSSLPVVDTTSIVEGSSDPTKEIRFEVDGLTSGTVRVLTPPDWNATLASLEGTQTFSGAKTFTATTTTNSIYPASQDTHALGSGNNTWYNVSANFVEVVRSASDASFKFYMQSTNVLYLYDPDLTTIQTWDKFQHLVTLRGTFIPSGTYDLGATGYEWDEVHFSKLASSNYTASGSPASAATHKVPFYDANGNFLNYFYLYP